MIITRLRLKDFQRHAELDLKLTPGLNVIRGPNEAGKSTVQKAIEMGLFRRPTSGASEIEDVRSWSAPSDDPAIEIGFEEDGKPGVLQKVFAGHHGTVEFNWADETLNDPAAVEQRIAEMTGLPSEKFLRSTASVHHHDLDGLGQDEGALRDRLQKSISGADRGTQAARKKLDDTIRRYRTEGAKNPGYLKVLRSDVERLTADRNAGDLALVRLEHDRSALAEAHAARDEVDARIVEHTENAARAERAVQLAARAAEANKRYILYRRATELRGEIDRLEGSHPSPVPVPQLRSTIDHVRQIAFNLSEMRAELAAEPDLSGYELTIPEPRYRPWVALVAILIVGGVVALVAGLLLGLLIVGLVVAAGLVVGAVLAFTRARFELQKYNDIRIQNELRESEIARRLAGRNQLAEKVRQGELEQAEMLASIHAADITTAERIVTAETEHLGAIANKRAEYRGLMGVDPNDDDVAALRDQAAAEAEEGRHTLAGMGEMGQQPDRHLALYKTNLQRLAPERDAVVQSESAAEARLAANTVDAEQVAATAETLSQAEQELAAAERRLRIYEDVVSALDAATRGTMKKAARFLEQHMVDDVERITGGRYRRLRVNEQTLRFSVFAPELDNWIDVERLSQGTMDQLYLCARLGIVRQVTEGGTPPLLFDDPFVSFDDDRAERALNMLKELGSEFQVILFSCSDRYDKVADNVIVLPAPTGRDEREPVAVASDAEALSMWSSAGLPKPETRDPLAAASTVAAPANKSGAAHQDAAQPAAAQTVTALPAAAQPGAAHQDVAQPGVAQLGAAQPGAAQPGAAQPAAAQTETVLSAATQPGSASPAVASPPVAQPAQQAVPATPFWPEEP